MRIFNLIKERYPISFLIASILGAFFSTLIYYTDFISDIVTIINYGGTLLSYLMIFFVGLPYFIVIYGINNYIIGKGDLFGNGWNCISYICLFWIPIPIILFLPLIFDTIMPFTFLIKYCKDKNKSMKNFYEFMLTYSALRTFLNVFRSFSTNYYTRNYLFFL